ncbi:MAG: MFS transporter [Firmicutes bacterium]|nr:MFS transporter [Bacillota bacterium]
MTRPVSRLQTVYPWLICGSCLLMIFCSVGICGNTMPIHFPFLARERGFSNTGLSAFTTIRCGFAFVTMGLLPRIMKLLRLRLIPLLSCLIVAASMLLMAVAQSLLQLYLAAAGIGLAYGLGSMVLASVLMRNWFRAREGFALSLCACGSGLANLVASPLITYAIEHFGLAAALRLEAAAVTVFGVIMAAVIRDEPARLGLQPYGCGREQPEQAAAAAQSLPPVRMSPRHCRLLILAALFTGPDNITTCNFFTLQYSSCGYSPMVIAAGLSMFGLLLTLSKLIYGWCNDRFGVYVSNRLFLGLSILGNLWVALAPLFSFKLSIFIGLGLCALGYPPMMIGFSLWARDLQPPESYTGTVALYQQLSMGGGMAVTLLGGWLADLTGSYTPAYLSCMLLLILALAFVQYLYRYYGRDRAAGPRPEREGAAPS